MSLDEISPKILFFTDILFLNRVEIELDEKHLC
jgi:hypothetical protein